MSGRRSCYVPVIPITGHTVVLQTPSTGVSEINVHFFVKLVFPPVSGIFRQTGVIWKAESVLCATVILLF